jgi:hypothetical protein
VKGKLNQPAGHYVRQGIAWMTGKPTVTSKAEEYRRHAEECLDAAEVIRNAKERAILLRIAHTWMQLAEQEDAAAAQQHRAHPAEDEEE